MSKWKEGGIFVVDHRNSPGITAEEMRALGLDHPGFKAGSVVETPTKKCVHCQKTVLMNPKRIRGRMECTKCSGFLCDRCALKFTITGECKNFVRAAMHYLEQTFRKEAGYAPLPNLPWDAPGNIKGK